MVEEKNNNKKIEELKKTPENIAAVAKSQGKSPVQKDDLTKHEEKAKSKPAVEKATKKTDKKSEGVVELEREYIVPMKKGFMNVPRYRRAKKAVKILKEFMVRHMKVRSKDLKKIKVDINLNNEIWFRGIKNPLNKVKVLAKKIDGIVHVTLADPSDYVKFKMAREEKRKIASVAPGKLTKTKEKAPVDANKDGIEDKVEEKEDVASEAEKDAKKAKIEAKIEHHTAKGEHKQKVASTKGLK